MHNSTLQNLKLYLALDSDGHYVISNEMKKASDAQWFNPSCSCPVKLRNNTSGEDAWFVHNPDEATKPLLANCGYLNTEIKRRVFILRLRTMIDELDTLTATRYWFCVWCKSHYEGEKHCKACNTGIYSISHGDWCWNYNHKENASEICDTTYSHQHKSSTPDSLYPILTALTVSPLTFPCPEHKNRLQHISLTTGMNLLNCFN